MMVAMFLTMPATTAVANTNDPSPPTSRAQAEPVKFVQKISNGMFQTQTQFQGDQGDRPR